MTLILPLFPRDDHFASVMRLLKIIDVGLKRDGQSFLGASSDGAEFSFLRRNEVIPVMTILRGFNKNIYSV